PQRPTPFPYTTLFRSSTERILTTHTGSLPRPADLTTMLEALDAGTLADTAAFAARVRQAIDEIVRKQIDAGIDIVDDGEQGKVGDRKSTRLNSSHRTI